MYKEFEINVTTSKLALVSVATIKKIYAAKNAGFIHGTYEGDELQLPAVFLIENGGRVKYAKYAKNLANMPSYQVMLALL